ncbi:hypothetical protein RclHR1_01140012 [Rhizophagus clarus]|uniref:Crinkler effector protein N-terminal domain-containing protein n=1 Tax=Rhizophagus clarus TaxID=94130 RepID=A0A2Z6Q3Y3_9GLOM|nr:hypothetical protein RclHR1_01140012 [Rhizophagus clarus]
MSATETYSGQDVLASYLRERRGARSALLVKSERDGDGLRTYWKGVIEERRKVKRKSDDEEKENFYPSSKRSRSIISLVCLVKGNTIANAFPIDIDRNQLVGHLKQVIREEIDIPENVKAKDLRLWKVEIPDDHDDQLRNLPLQDKDELLATKKISRYFPFTLPEEHINIIIKLPLLSMEEALSYPPPYIKYSPYGTTSKSTTRVGGTPPKKVMLWEDFFESVNKYSFDELDQEQKFKEPIFIDDFIVTEEEVVRQAINVNICLILNRLIPVFKFSMRKVHSTGKPDFCCHYLDKLLTLVIEAKRVHILESIEDGQTLPDFYKTNAKIRAVVQQLYNYMSENQLQFGVLSTYDRHWFVKRDYQDVYISESLPLDSKSPPVLKSYAYIALQEKESPYSLHPNRVRVQTEGAQQSRYDLRPRRLHNNSSSSSNT